MAYIAAADFRVATLQEWCQGLDLTTTEAGNTNLAGAIARHSQRVDDLTGDRFSTVSETAYVLNGDGTATLELPQRCTRVYRLFTISPSGTQVLEDADTYRLQSSLDADGARRVGEFDSIEVTELGSGLAGTFSPWAFDKAVGSVSLDADFGWSVTPPDIKRAVALMCYAQFKPQADVLQQAQQWSDAGSVYVRGTGGTGIPEADEIISSYRRQTRPAFG